MYMYLQYKIQEIFPSKLAYHINKLVYWHSFIYLICNSFGKYFLYFKLKMDYSIYTLIKVLSVDSYMDSEQYEEAVRDYEKICNLDRSRGKLPKIQKYCYI